jgi:polyisoprenoid-binding protein YceI
MKIRAGLMTALLAVASTTNADPFEVPAGAYVIDPNHSTLHFSVVHLGFSNYTVRFDEFDGEVTLGETAGDSSVTFTVNPRSISTDYSGDYKATHPDSPHASWDDQLANGEEFLNAGTHPEIRFVSRSVGEKDDGSLAIDGDLTLLGQTHPVTLAGMIVGQGENPFSGAPSIGFSIQGAFNRSTFGMEHLVGPISDEVKVRFEGEFQKTEG